MSKGKIYIKLFKNILCIIVLVLALEYYTDWRCPSVCVVIDALSKPNHYPERIFTFEASDSDEELRLRIQQVSR